MTYTVQSTAAWSIDQLAPYMSDILGAMGKLAKRYPRDVTTAALFQEFLAGRKTLWLVLAALGDSLMGGPMAAALGLPREKARELARRQLIGATMAPDCAGS